MKKEGILDKIILVGSWCILLYEDYFKGKGILPAIRTRDLEFLIPIPPDLDRKTNLYELLKDLGFVLDYKGEQGCITFQHPDLILEFLVPARGKESDKPYPIDQLGINAQALRFMDFLAQDPIQMVFHDIKVTLPHPANFALQKLLIAERRKQKDKAEKDRIQAVAVLTALDASAEFTTVCALYHAMPKKLFTHDFISVVGDDDPPFLEENCIFHSWRVAVLQDEPSLRPEPQGEGRVNPQRPLGFFDSLVRQHKRTRGNAHEGCDYLPL